MYKPRGTRGRPAAGGPGLSQGTKQGASGVPALGGAGGDRSGSLVRAVTSVAFRDPPWVSPHPVQGREGPGLTGGHRRHPAVRACVRVCARVCVCVCARACVCARTLSENKTLASYEQSLRAQSP